MILRKPILANPNTAPIKRSALTSPLAESDHYPLGTSDWIDSDCHNYSQWITAANSHIDEHNRDQVIKIIKSTRDRFWKLAAYDDSINNLYVHPQVVRQVELYSSLFEIEQKKIESDYQTALAYISDRFTTEFDVNLTEWIREYFKKVNSYVRRVVHKIKGLLRTICTNSLSIDKRSVLRKKLKLVFSKQDDEDLNK